MASIFLGGTVRPGSVDPIADPIDFIDGWRSVADITARNAISPLYLRKGMVVVTQDTLTAYQLSVVSPPTWVLANLLDFSISPTWTGTHIFNNAITVATPTLGGHAATKAYVDAFVAGLDTKASVRISPTADFSTFTASGSGVGKTLTAPTDSATHNTQDGFLLVVGNRVLVTTAGGTATTPHLSNGIYTVFSLGDGAGTSLVLTRATDADTSGELNAGTFTFVEEGTINGDNGWVLITNDPIVVDTTALQFTQFIGAGQIDAGAGLTKTGNQLNVGAGFGILANPNDVAINLAATFTGANAWTGAHEFNGNVTLGNATSDTLTVTSSIVGDLNFVAEAAHSVQVLNSTTSGVAGGNLTVRSGNGAADGAFGGNFVSITGNGGTGGAATNGGRSGDNALRTGTGGVAGSLNPGGSGNIILETGLPGAATAGFGGGLAGSIVATVSSGGVGSATAAGGTGGSIAATAGAGGVNNGGGSGLAGSVDVIAGAGAAGSGSSPPSAGGSSFIRGGVGGAGTASTSGATGGGVVLFGRIGGANAGAGAGVGGTSSFLGGAGAAGSGSSAGALGGSGSLIAGIGGAGTASALPGKGGGITIVAGDAGANGGFGYGLGGDVIIDSGNVAGSTTNNGFVDIGLTTKKVLLGNSSGPSQGIELRGYLHNTASLATNPLSLQADGNAVIRIATNSGSADVGMQWAAAGGGGRDKHIVATGTGNVAGAGLFAIYDTGFGDYQFTIDAFGKTRIFGRNDAFNAAKDGGRFLSLGLEVNAAALTAIPASVEFPDVNFNITRTAQFNTGAIATQRAVKIGQPTYAFVGASTITTAATVAIAGAPVAGTNATLTNSYALFVESGHTRLDGNLSVAGNTFIGDALADEITLTSMVTGGIRFKNNLDIEHSITADAATTVGVAGEAIFVRSGGGAAGLGAAPGTNAGGVGVAGGVGGAGTATAIGGNGGSAQFVGGNGGANAGGGGGSGGFFYIKGGDGAAGSGSSPGSNAAVTCYVLGGSGGAGTATASAGGGGDLLIQAGSPGVNNGGGAPGGVPVQIFGGNGADGSGSSAGTTGGNARLIGGLGGSGTASASGGTGGAVVLTARDGGTNAGGGGGIGGSSTFTGGAGAAGSGSSPGALGGATGLTSGSGGVGGASSVGGLGGNLALLSGTGGASAGGGLGGNGGQITIISAAGGAPSGTFAGGNAGPISIQGNSGQAGTATAAPSLGGTVSIFSGNGGSSLGVGVGKDGAQMLFALGQGGNGSGALAAGAGGALSIITGLGGIGGASSVSGDGGGFNLATGNAGANGGGGAGIGGYFQVVTGNGAAASGATAGNRSGTITIGSGSGGASNGVAAGGTSGSVSIYTGLAAAANGAIAGVTSGVINIEAGISGAASSTAGGTAAVGAITTIRSGQGGAGAGAVNGPGAGGALWIRAAAAGTYGGFGGANGGNVRIFAGTGSGSGVNGTVQIGDTETAAVEIGQTAVTTTTVFGTFVAANFAWTVTSIKTSAYTAAFGETVRVDPTGAGFTVNLPTAVGKSGQQIKVKNVSASGNTVTLDAFSTETIDGATTYLMTTGYESVTLESDGTNWMVV